MATKAKLHVQLASSTVRHVRNERTYVTSTSHARYIQYACVAIVGLDKQPAIPCTSCKRVGIHYYHHHRQSAYIELREPFLHFGSLQVLLMSPFLMKNLSNSYSICADLVVGTTTGAVFVSYCEVKLSC